MADRDRRGGRREVAVAQLLGAAAFLEIGGRSTMASVQTLAPTALRRMLSVAEWEALEDPIGGRYEILDGRLVVNPSPGGDHNRIGEDLADMIRAAIDDAELDYEVTIDVEWRVVENGRVPQAPRGDIVIGHLDPSKGIHYELPLSSSKFGRLKLGLRCAPRSVTTGSPEACATTGASASASWQPSMPMTFTPVIPPSSSSAINP